MPSEVLWPILLYFALVLVVVGVMLGVPAIAGQRHMQPATGEQYESGIVSAGAGRIRVDVKFYLVAMLFVVFDLEAMFIFAWAVALREAGWAGFVEALVFLAVLAASLVYLWRLGALDWAPKHKRRTGD